jgi:hypothetical protein
MAHQLVTDVWIGDPADPPAQSRSDVIRALTLVTASGLAATVIATAAIAAFR